MHKLPCALVACTAIALLAQFTTSAQDSRFYLKGDLGGALTEDTDLKEPVFVLPPPRQAHKVKFDPGARVGFTAGYQITDWVSAEAELGTMVNSLPSSSEFLWFIGGQGPFFMHDARLANVPLLLNLNLRYPNRSRWTPYIGGGCGVSAAILDMDTESGPDFGSFSSGHDTEADAVFAYQGFAGLCYRLSDRLKISVEYRYFATESPHWTMNVPGSNIGFGAIKTHSISLALDYRF